MIDDMINDDDLLDFNGMYKSTPTCREGKFRTEPPRSLIQHTDGQK